MPVSLSDEVRSSEAPAAPSPALAFSQQLLPAVPPRDFQAARTPLVTSRSALTADRRATLSAAQEETAQQTQDLTTDAQRDEAARRAATPGPHRIPAAPPPTPRPLLTPGDTLLGQIGGLITALGAVGLQIGGLRGSAAGAVGAMKGMAEGWAQGDADRIEREQKAWKLESERLLTQHADAVEAYKRLVEDQKLTTAQKRVAGTLRLKGYEWRSAMQAVESEDIAAQLKELDSAEARHHALDEKIREFNLGLTQKREHDKEWAAQQRENRAQRADATEATLALRRDIAQGRQDLRRDAPMPGAGAWIHVPSGDRRSSISRGEHDAAPSDWKRIDMSDVRSLEILEAEAPNQVAIMRAMIPRILAENKGENLGRLVKNYLDGKLSSPSVRRFMEAGELLNISLGRALSGSPSPRIAVMKKLETAIPTLGERQETAHLLLDDIEQDIENRIRGIKGQKILPPRNLAAPRVLVGPDGKEYDGTGVDPGSLKPGWKLR